MGRSSLIAFSFVLSIICPFRKDLLRLVVFFVSMWLAFDFAYVNLPEPVFLKRFAAARFVFIFGITFSLILNDFAKKIHDQRLFTKSSLFQFIIQYQKMNIKYIKIIGVSNYGRLTPECFY